VRGLNVVDILDRLVALGCTVWVEDEKVKVCGPGLTEILDLVTTLWLHRGAALAFLKEQKKQTTLPRGGGLH
jgi:hypothetical protein